MAQVSSHILDWVKYAIHRIPHPVHIGKWFFLDWLSTPYFSGRIFTLCLWGFVLQIRDTDKLLFSARNGYVAFRWDIWFGLTIIIDWRHWS